MLFTIIGFLGSILIISYYFCKTEQKNIKQLMTDPDPPEEPEEAEFEQELQKELNTIIDDEKEQLIATIRRRLKPKVSSSSEEVDLNQS